MIELIRQRWAVDCGICCIAMATGESYYRTMMAAPLGFDEILYGLTLNQIVTTMRRLGYAPKWHWPEKFSPNKVGEPLREQMRGKNAIHLVPSINRDEEGAYHYVLVSDGVIYDPTPRRRRYRRYEQLNPLGVVYQP